jgi:hypothetical protein
MNNQRFALAAVAFGGLCFAAAGCILGDDPNKNSQIFGALGGATGNGGPGGAGGGGGSANSVGDIIGVPIATFDTSTDSLAFSMYDEPTNLAVHNGGMPPTVEFDASDGSPASASSGSLKVFAPYSGANQYVDLQRPYPASMLQNWMGGRLHVRVKVDAGSTFAGQIEPYADTTSAFIFVGTSLNVAMGGGWHDYVVPLDTAMTRNLGYDLKQVIAFGVHIGSGGAGASQGPVTFHIDSFSVEGIAAPATDAGSDTGGGNSDAAGN